MDQRLQQARQIDEMSTVLIDTGVRFIKRNPIPVGFYVLGILLCLLFSGFKTPHQDEVKFQERLRNVDYTRLDKLSVDLDYAQHDYRRSKGWFTCDQYCQKAKTHLSNIEIEHNLERRKFEKQISDAKAGIGIFSESGVSETRDLFWLRFAQGKGFATRQSKWDALFMGIGAMSRDEGMLSYILRLLMTVLFNFTLGMMGAVVGFVFSIPSLLYTYQVPLLYGALFLALSSLAALAFAVTWLAGIYTAAAGAVYVGAKLVASNMRIQGDAHAGPGRPQRVHFDSGTGGMYGGDRRR